MYLIKRYFILHLLKNITQTRWFSQRDTSRFLKLAHSLHITINYKQMHILYNSKYVCWKLPAEILPLSSTCYFFFILSRGIVGSIGWLNVLE